MILFPGGVARRGKNTGAPYTPRHSYITRYLTIKSDFGQPAVSNMVPLQKPRSESSQQMPDVSTLLTEATTVARSETAGLASSTPIQVISCTDSQVCSVSPWSLYSQVHAVEPDI